MALLQIAEPGQSAAPHQRKLAIGIDLGTTHSLVATVRSGQAETLADERARHLLPSAVQYTEDNTIVGYKAYENAAQDAQNTIISVKRFIGRSVEDVLQTWPNLPYD
ncbi:MAG: Hsp70 family protein, partial [Alteromonas sp.]